MARGMPGGMQVIDGVLPRPPNWRSAWAAAKIASYSGVSGAFCPRPAGFVGSHWPTLRPVHWPDQSGYFHSARAGVGSAARPRATEKTAETAIVRFDLLNNMSFLPRR